MNIVDTSDPAREWRRWHELNLCDRCLWYFDQGGGPEWFCDRCKAKIEAKFGIKEKKQNG
jgi:hypothetical protein